MKNLVKPLVVVLGLSVALSSCMKKDNTDYEAIKLQEEKSIDSLFTAQKKLIEEYLLTANPAITVQDTVSVRFPLLKKTIKRGIWYQVISEPTDNTYEYKYNSTGTGPVRPTVKIKYKTSLLNGTVVQSDEVGSNYSFSSPNTKIMNYAWVVTFFPYSIKFNGDDKIIEGLTKNGLKKGSKIRVVTPSLWTFGGTAQEKIPANSPLVYDFEVISIE